MKKSIFLALFTALLSCTGPKKTTELVVGMDLSYPPFETIDEQGQPQGVSVDLATALAQAVGRKVRIENIPFTGLVPSLQNGRIDCVLSSMTDTPERRNAISFSDPYLSTGLAVLVGKKTGLMTAADLDQPGRTVVVRQGTTGEVWAQGHIKNAKILSVEKENAAVLEVVQGKADAFVYDQMSIWQNARRQPESTRALLTPIQREQWAIGVKKGNTELLEEINGFLKSYRAEGGFERLGDKYLREQKAAFADEGVPFVF